MESHFCKRKIIYAKIFLRWAVVYLSIIFPITANVLYTYKDHRSRESSRGRLERIVDQIRGVGFSILEKGSTLDRRITGRPLKPVPRPCASHPPSSRERYLLSEEDKSYFAPSACVRARSLLHTPPALSATEHFSSGLENDQRERGDLYSLKINLWSFQAETR